MRTVLYIALVVILIVGLIIFFSSDMDTTPDPQTNDPDQTNDDQQQTSDRERFEAALGDTARISLSHRPAIEVSKVNDSVVELTYIGPDSEPNTEITDGYYASIQLIQQSDLEAYAQSEAAGQIQSLPFNGQPGVTFTTQSELGNQSVTHIAYQPVNSTEYIIDIAYSIYASDDGTTSRYQSELLDTLSTLQVFVTIETAGEQTIMLAMLDYDGIGEESTGPSRGCDRLVMVERTIESTNAPLNASLETLFGLEEETVGGWNNFIAQVNDTLMFDRATIEDGTANIYLTGELTGLGGVCDNPRARIQIEETALQFDTVNDVQLYLNGEATELQPSGA